MKIGFPTDVPVGIESSSIILERLPKTRSTQVEVSIPYQNTKEDILSELLYGDAEQRGTPYRNHMDVIEYYQHPSRIRRPVGSLKYVILSQEFSNSLIKDDRLFYCGNSSQLALLLAFAQQNEHSNDNRIVNISAQYSWDQNNDILTIEPLRTSYKSLLSKWKQTVQSNIEALLLHEVDAKELANKCSDINKIALSDWDPKNFIAPVLIEVGTTDISKLVEKLRLDKSYFNTPYWDCWNYWGDNIFDPYLGLLSYEEEHQKIFFGRDDEVSCFFEKLKKKKFLVLVGPSGVGKSSLVKAGVIPLIKQLEQQQTIVINVRPGKSPLKIFADSLRKVINENNLPDIEFDERTVDNYSESLCRAISSVSDKYSLVVYIDQFEEYFGCESDFKQQTYLQLIQKLHNFVSGRASAYFIISIRDDFWYRFLNCFKTQDLNEFAYRHGFFLRNIEDRNCLEQIVCGPFANTSRYNFVQPDFCERIVSDTKGKPGSLPFLSQILRKMWENRYIRRDYDGKLCIAGYEALGGVEGVLNKLFEEAYTKAINIETQERQACFVKTGNVVNSILVQLAKNDSTGASYIRNIVSAKQLMTSHCLSEKTLRKLINPFEVSRLFVISKLEDKEDDYNIEISHESIYSAQIYRKILTDNEDVLRCRENLAHSVIEYEARRGPLWDDEYGRLSFVEKCILEGRIAPSTQEDNFIQQSRKRVIKKRQYVLVASSVLLLALIAVIAIISTQLANARRHEKKLIFNALIDKAKLWESSNKPFDEQLALYRAAYETGVDDDLSMKVVEDNIIRLSSYYLGPRYSTSEYSQKTEYSPSGNYALTANDKSQFRIFDANTGRQISISDSFLKIPIQITFSEDENWVAIRQWLNHASPNSKLSIYARTSGNLVAEKNFTINGGRILGTLGQDGFLVANEKEQILYFQREKIALIQGKNTQRGLNYRIDTAGSLLQNKSEECLIGYKRNEISGHNEPAIFKLQIANHGPDIEAMPVNQNMLAAEDRIMAIISEERYLVCRDNKQICLLSGEKCELQIAIETNCREVKYSISKNKKWLVLDRKKENEIYDLEKTQYLTGNKNVGFPVVFVGDKVVMNSRSGEGFLVVKDLEYPQREEIVVLPFDKADTLYSFTNEALMIVENGKQKYQILLAGNIHKSESKCSLIPDDADILDRKKIIRERVRNKIVDDELDVVMEVSKDYKRVYIALKNGSVAIYSEDEKRSPAFRKILYHVHSDVIWNIKELIAKKRLLTDARGDGLKIWNIENEFGGPTDQKKGPQLQTEIPGVRKYTVSENGELLAYLSERENSIFILNTYTGVILRKMPVINAIDKISFGRGKQEICCSSKAGDFVIKTDVESALNLFEGAGEKSNLRVCKNNYKIVPAMPFPPKNSVWADELLCNSIK